mgnify:CR=1 FL=1
MISWNGAAQALIDASALNGAPLDQVILLYIGFTVPQYYAQAGHNKSWNSQTWTALDIEIRPVDDSVDSRNALTFTFPGVTTGELALALSGDVEGAAVQLYSAICNPADGTVADAKLRWAGQLDIPGWQDGALALVHFTAEHLADIAARPKPIRYTSDAQQRLYPGDTFLDIDPLTDAAGRVWPSASYFKVQIGRAHV